MDNEYALITENGELIHAGVKDMKWGIRRYQNPDGSLTPLGRIHYGVKQARTKAKRKAALKKANETRAAKKQAAAEAKAKEEEKKAAEEELAKKKADLLQRPTAKEIYENRHLFTYQELNAAKMRIEMERSIHNLEPAPVDKGKQFTDNLIKTADTVANVANSGSKAYNAVAKIYNSLYGNKHDAGLPMIEEKVVTALDKYKQETELIKAKNERRNALDAAKEKVKSELELYKEETEWLKAKNERKKAADESAPKEKSELEKLREQNAMAEAENRRREIERTSRDHDRKDRKEQERDAKEAKDAEEAKKNAEQEAKRKAKRKADEQARLANEERSRAEYEGPYHRAGGSKEQINPNKSRGLSVFGSSGSMASAASRGKSYAESAASSNKTDANVISQIAAMTRSGNKSYSEIAQQLGVSTTTVQTYSRHQESANQWVNENGSSRVIDMDDVYMGDDGRYHVR